MDVIELTPARALRIITPAALVVSTALEKPPPSWEACPWQASLTIAWKRGSRHAAAMERYVAEVARDFLARESPLALGDGIVPGPLLDGDLERPADAHLHDHVFAEVAGDLSVLLDARRKPVRKLDVNDPAHAALAGPGSVVRMQAYLFAVGGRVRIQLAGILAIVRLPPAAALGLADLPVADTRWN